MGTTYNFGASSHNIVMKVFICLSAVLALASCEPFLTSGPAAGPVHAAVGGLVATKRGYRVSFLQVLFVYLLSLFFVKNNLIDRKKFNFCSRNCFLFCW